MVFSRRSRISTRAAPRRAVRRTTVRRRPTRKVAYSRLNARVSRRLNDGIRWKQHTIDRGFTLAPGLYNYNYAEDYVMTIPKYRFDSLATATQGNLQVARTSDKLFLKGFNCRIGLTNKSTMVTYCRFILIRASNLFEAVSAFSANWIMDPSGTAVAPSLNLSTFLTQRFNTDLVKNKSKDILFDKTVRLGIFMGDGPIPSSRLLKFYIPCSHTVQFEAKGTAADSDDLKTGKYCLLAMTTNEDGGTNAGNIECVTSITATYAEA